MRKLLANRWQTPDGTILWSKHTHDFILYTDKNGKQYGIDGGNDYCRIIGDFTNMKNLCIYDDGKFETRREYVTWGTNYDKNMNLLPKTLYKPIKDLTEEHIYKILELPYLSNYMKNLFEDEIIYRENQII